MDKYPELNFSRKTGEEKFHANGKPLGHDLLSFWQWSASNLVENAMRGILAEYIVASAIDKANGCRAEWDAFDIETPEGVKVEVKSAAYIQSWSQKEYSNIQFSIRPTQGWNHESSQRSSVACRQADVYVFCLLKNKDQASMDPLDLDQWVFYVLPTFILDQSLGGQKTITLSSLSNLDPRKVSYSELYAAIKVAVGS